jgi:hypothetical protein
MLQGFCHPEMGSPYFTDHILPSVGRAGWSTGVTSAQSTCSAQGRRGGAGIACRCLVPRVNEPGVRSFYGGALPDVPSLTLVFGDGEAQPSAHTASSPPLVAVSRVGLPDDGFNGRCSGGSRRHGIVSIGKVGQLNCRRNLARRSGCVYESLRLQAAQYDLSQEDECSAFLRATKVDAGSAWMIKPAVSSFGRGIRYLPPGTAYGEAKRICRSQRRGAGLPVRLEGAGLRLVAMRYIEPMLVTGGFKVDFRSYLLVARTRPALAFVHDGFARRADLPFNGSSASAAVHGARAAQLLRRPPVPFSSSITLLPES